MSLLGGFNPIVQTIFTADPAPMVHDGRLYVYTGHDAFGSTYFTMDNLMVYSTTDLINWTDHGSAMVAEDFCWAKKNTLWASQTVERNGKFYAYVPIERANGEGPAIGVGVSDSPTGPFIDPLGKPLVTAGVWAGDIDPTVFIDDDGQAYMYWGNPQLYYVLLNEDMISTAGEIVRVPMIEESFGPRRGGPEERYPTSYEEGPWFYKRDGMYYLIFSAGKLAEHIAYATSKNPTGPWQYQGIIMSHEEKGAAFTNHSGIAHYMGRNYFFYHNQWLTHVPGFTGGFTRSTAVEEFEYGTDGSIPKLNMTTEKRPALATFDPYSQTEATTLAWASGVETKRNSNGNMTLCPLNSDSYVIIRNVDFGNGATKFATKLSAEKPATIELRLGNPKGQQIGQLEIAPGGSQVAETAITNASGLQDLVLLFKGDSLQMEHWQFYK
ncbi:MAG: glycoside hydrolase family 43 protein [Defluviitaleaceae bacterium]|nr:glycoside hydrolase family 43 protein [Defluviitaleaceae bacterium]